MFVFTVIIMTVITGIGSVRVPTVETHAFRQFEGCERVRLETIVRMQSLEMTFLISKCVKAVET